ncbi:MAG: hypothetical protein H5U28_01005 [Burkholderiaceae bacterium]|nr:hypothetical protein [Burkholderiaceae bacterium]
MRFVVPIPLSLYLIFLLIAFAIGMYVFAIVVALGFIYFLFKAPKETIGFVLLLLAFKYWKIALPLLGVAVVINYFFGDKVKQKNAPMLLDANPNANPKQEDNSQNA